MLNGKNGEWTDTGLLGAPSPLPRSGVDSTLPNPTTWLFFRNLFLFTLGREGNDRRWRDRTQVQLGELMSSLVT